MELSNLITEILTEYDECMKRIDVLMVNTDFMGRENEKEALRERDRILWEIEEKYNKISLRRKQENIIRKQVVNVVEALSYSCSTDVTIEDFGEWENTVDDIINALKPQILDKIRKGEL